MISLNDSFTSSPLSLIAQLEKNGKTHQSKLNKTTLSNYILSISLMKNITLRFANFKLYQTESMAQISRILELESKYGLNSSNPEVGVSFLVNQHIKEILDKYSDFQEVLRLTFTKEFNKMILACIFMPFLHQETPIIIRIQKSELKLEFLRPNPDLIQTILKVRQDIIDGITKQQANSYMSNSILNSKPMVGIPETDPFNEDDEDQITIERSIDTVQNPNNISIVTNNNINLNKLKTKSKIENAYSDFDGQSSQNEFSRHDSKIENEQQKQILAASHFTNTRQSFYQSNNQNITPVNRGSISLSKPKSQSMNQRGRRNITHYNIYGTQPPQQLNQSSVNYYQTQPKEVDSKFILRYSLQSNDQQKITLNSENSVRSPKLSQSKETTSKPTNLTTGRLYQNIATQQVYAQRLQQRSEQKEKFYADQLVKKYQSDPITNLKMRNEIENRITQILDSSANNFSMIYNHPKLLNQFLAKERSNSYGARSKNQQTRNTMNAIKSPFRNLNLLSQQNMRLNQGSIS
ncbi:UNKNOWN [Stylonychia lemnae]|uniref:Uncharacterized protein n=1 Tax=Stylonychia lemnae TaxID=5949 RepID=A0A078B5G0_STYLE|nr:UNKNOWN [Stylonychia lemnae]|eukprot:CDW89760.1 UNKNOWN [Stylonychia lemnae]